FESRKRQDFYKKHQILHQESYSKNHQNMEIFTQTWQPADPSLKLQGVVAMIHGYTSESSWLFELNAVAMERAGFVCCAMDLRGHGFSEGPRDHVSDINPMVSDFLHFKPVPTHYVHPNLPRFLYGESLGGAIAIIICLQQKKEWKGLILSGAMCEISSKFKPVWPLEKLLLVAAYVAPSWRIVITSAPLSKAYMEDWKRKLAENSPNRRTSGKPTAASALQFMRTCENIKRSCHLLEVPLLVMHGGDDIICDPQGAKYLYETASSKDKSLKIFGGVWHQLIGEPNESAERIFNTMMEWIEVRADSTLSK
ncbi:caffeoylshikimate esterase-like, partial [Dorcoceras hygrometricum]